MKRKLMSLFLAVMMVLSIFTPVLSMDVEEPGTDDEVIADAIPEPVPDDEDPEENPITDSEDHQSEGDNKESEGKEPSGEDGAGSDDDHDPEDADEDKDKDSDAADGDESEDENTETEDVEELIHQTLTASVGGYGVKVEGALPEGITLVAEQVALSMAEKMVDDIDEYEIVFAVDITLYLDGFKYEIPETVTVTIENLSIPADNAVRTIHVTDSGNEVVDTILGPDEVLFKAPSFSVFIIEMYGTDEVKNGPTVSFQVGDEVVDGLTWVFNEDESGVYYLTPGHLKAPSLPFPDGMVSFRGWALKGESAFFTVNDPITEDITLVAVFSDEYLIKFEDTFGTVVDTQEVTPGEAVSDSIKDFTLPHGHLFEYWYIADGNESDPPAAYNFNTPVNSDMTLKAWTSDGNYVIFVSEGTYVDPVRVPSGKSINDVGGVEKPTRDGFTFKHWTTKRETGESYSFNTVVDDTLILYAVWEGNKVNYTVVYWIEKANFDGTPEPGNLSHYNYAHSEVVKDSIAGEMTNVTGISRNATSSIDPKESRYPLKYATAQIQDNTNKVILGNGSTVVNVFCRRNIYNFEFDLNTNGGKMTFKEGYKNAGEEYTSGNQRYTFQAKYEQNIENDWPSAWNCSFEKERSNNGFHSWDPGGHISKRFTVTHDLMPSQPEGSTKIFQAKWGDVKTVVVNYWLERLPEDAEGPIWKGLKNPNYKLSTYHSQVLVLSGGLDPKRIEGMENQGSLTQKYNKLTNYYIPEYGYNGDYTPQLPTLSGDNIENNFFYKRNRYALIYDANGGRFGDTMTERQKSGILFEESLNKDMYRNIDAPTRTENGVVYKFTGWYLDADCREEFDFTNTTMPLNDLRIYAGWESTDLMVNFYNSEKDQEPVKSAGVTRQHALSPESSPYQVGDPVEGKGEFLGWYYYQNVGTGAAKIKVDFEFDMVFGADTNLYASWKTDGFTLTYDAGNGTGTVPTDNKTYSLGSKTRIQGGEQLDANDRMATFIGWKVNGIGEIIHPSSLFTMNGNTTLVAQYGKPGDYIRLTFHPNYESLDSSPLVWMVQKNSEVTLADGIFERTGYALIGWSTEPGDHNLLEYYLGHEGYQMGTESVDLYAVWERAVFYGDLTVSKLITGEFDNDSFTGTISITVEDEPGNLIGTQVLSKNNNWEYTFKKLPTGTYTVTESGGDIEHYDYTVDNKSVQIEVEDGKNSVVFENNYYRTSGDLTVVKKFKGDEPNDGWPAITIAVSGNDLEKTLTYPLNSDNNWEHTFKNLKPGTYEITETAAQTSGYSYEKEVDGDSTVAAGKESTVVFTNTYKKEYGEDDNRHSSLTINKVDVDGQLIKASAAIFTLYEDKSCKTPVLSNIITVEGVAAFSTEELDEGTYYLKETQAPDGYIAGNDVWTITVSKEQGEDQLIIDTEGDNNFWKEIYDFILGVEPDTNFDAETNTLTVKNTLVQASLTIEKTWSVLPENRWKEVTISLQRLNDDSEYEEIEEIKLNAANAWSHTFDELKLGTGKYKIVEDTRNMQVSGYTYRGVSYTGGGVFEVTDEEAAPDILMTVTNTYRRSGGGDGGETNPPTDPPTDPPLNIPDPEPPTDPGDPADPIAPPVDIVDPNPPTDPGPPYIDIPAPETPLSPGPAPGGDGLIDINDGEVPLADAPRTSDGKKLAGLWALLAASAFGTAFFTITGKKKKEAEADAE